MRGARTLALVVAVAALAGGPAGAQLAAPVAVDSAGPAKVSVTVYRAPGRAADTPIDRAAPQGYALITETRTVTIPAGRAVIRFQGVAGNIFPETAIVSGLPGEVREKNLDADLLSPRSLYDRALGRRVIIRRTNAKTGKVTEEQATIRSAADGAAVLQTGEGNEVLRCSGMPETLVYDGVPAGLSAKPTLSIQTDSPVERTVTLTLSYLAGGFDWQADYVATMRPDGKVDLFAWVTVASSDVTSFADAGAQVVAGRLNRQDNQPSFGDYSAGALNLDCWPAPDYSNHEPYAAVAPPPPPAPIALMAPQMEARDAIVVTGSRLRKAAQEELGDLKLYRIPDRVTVASKAQKQVAFLANDGVTVTPLYASEVYGGTYLSGPVLTLRTRNRRDEGLGLPLPAGKIALFENAGGRPMLIGQSSTADKAVGEDVDFKFAASPDVRADLTQLGKKGDTASYRLVVTNATSRPVAYEAKFFADGRRRIAAGRALARRDGNDVWTITVPANGTVTLDYRWNTRG